MVTVGKEPSELSEHFQGCNEKNVPRSETVLMLGNTIEPEMKAHTRRIYACLQTLSELPCVRWGRSSFKMKLTLVGHVASSFLPEGGLFLMAGLGSRRHGSPMGRGAKHNCSRLYYYNPRKKVTRPFRRDRIDDVPVSDALHEAPQIIPSHPQPKSQRVTQAFLKMGHCSNPSCRYAHSVDELRVALERPDGEAKLKGCAVL